MVDGGGLMRQHAENKVGKNDAYWATIAEGWRPAAARKWRIAESQKIPNGRRDMLNSKSSDSVIIQSASFS